MDPFLQAAEDYVSSPETQYTSGASQTQESSQSHDRAPALQSVSPAAETPAKQTEQAILDLSKHDKFTIAGRELTRDQLSKLMDDQKKFESMNKDYTQKTQRLSDDRKSFEGEQKFYTHLPYDLLSLQKDPARINEFLQAYPQKFHGYAEQILRDASAQVQAGQNTQSQATAKPDVQLLSRLQQVESILNEQKTAQRETEIHGIISEMDKKYPDAANFQEVVLGRAFEAQNVGKAQNPNFDLTKDDWENIYQQVDKEVSEKVKAKYGNLVKQQTEANKRAKDVSAGGGTVGRAPQKFKKFDDITKFAIEQADA